MTVCSNYGAAISRVSTTHEGGLTEPGQNIWPMHHGWTGGKAAWEGTKALRGTVGLGTDVEIVTVGIPVVARVVAAWGIAWAKWANPTRAANVMDIIWAGKPRSGRMNSDGTGVSCRNQRRRVSSSRRERILMSPHHGAFMTMTGAPIPRRISRGLVTDRCQVPSQAAGSRRFGLLPQPIFAVSQHGMEML